MQFRTVLDVKVVDVEKRRTPSKHYVSVPLRPPSVSRSHVRPVRRRSVTPERSIQSAAGDVRSIKAAQPYRLIIVFYGSAKG